MAVQARIAVFASGGGTNLQALIDRLNARPRSVARVELVVGSRPGIGALERAESAGIATLALSAEGAPAEDSRLLHPVLRDHRIDWVVLAGYLRLVPADVVSLYSGRMLNIHPALLPAFGGQGMYGRRVHEAVLRSGATVSGATVHLVDEEYDRGRILAQWPVPVLPGDTPGTLARRVLKVEHVLLPAVVEWLAGGVETARASALPDAAGYALRSEFVPAPEDIERLIRQS